MIFCWIQVLKLLNTLDEIENPIISQCALFYNFDKNEKQPIHKIVGPKGVEISQNIQN